MTEKINIANTTDVFFIGSVLLNYFIDSYPELYNEDVQDREKVKAAIKDVYGKLGITVDLEKAILQSKSDILPGDILVLPPSTANSNTTGDLNTYYSVVGIPRDGLNTFPKLPNKSFYSLGKNIAAAYNIIRLDFTNVSRGALEDFINKELPESIKKAFIEDTETFTVPFSFFPDGALQIGDITFLIDPQQLVFTTQNDYQIYPTMRTHGSPKLPTMSQFKNISITMIFTNTIGINYQLLNLFAMFRRTPFVNLRNNDINDFFSEIRGTSDYISVALESISIQSIEGFPSSVQVQLTFLPFDARGVTGSFQALRSMADVKKQQLFLSASTDDDRVEKSNAILGSSDITHSRMIKQLKPQINTTQNFKESLPFRAFYQALIQERTYVKDEFGSNVPTYDLSGKPVGSHYPLDIFRPTKEENFLHQYDPEVNTGPVKFKYNFIADNFRETTKILSKERINTQVKLIKELSNIANISQGPQDLASTFFTFYHTQGEALDGIAHDWERFDSSITEILVRQGIDTKDIKDYTLKGPFDFLIKTGWRNLSKAFLGVESIDGLSFKVPFGTELGKLLYDKNKTGISDDYLGIFNGIAIYDNGQIQTVKKYFDQWWAYINKGTDKEIEDKKKKFSNILIEVNNLINSSLTGTSFALTTGPDGNPDLDYNALPFLDEVVTIDNKKDIVVGWSLTFSNKFVPMNLQAFKYPFYQHLGSDDVNLTLRINSTSGELKNVLQSMSDRIYDTAKTVSLNSPDLLKWIDPRIDIDVPLGHIFKTFGVKKVVYNGSNTTSIDGSPGSWMTVLNLTEANFNLNEYHQIQLQHDNTDLEAAIIQFLLRLRLEKEGNEFRLVVKKPMKKVGENWELITDITSLFKLSFVFSNYSKDFEEYFKSLTNTHGLTYKEFRKTHNQIVGEKLAYQYMARIKFLESTIRYETDEVATQELNKLLLQDPSSELKNILMTISYSYEQILERELQALMNFVYEKGPSVWQRLLGAVNSESAEMTVLSLSLIIVGTAGLTIATGGLATILAAPLIATLMATGTIGLYMGVPGLLGELGSAVVDPLLQEAINEAKSGFGFIFSSMINEFKAASLTDTARQILSDPSVADKILSPSIMGTVNQEFVDEQGNKVTIDVGLNQTLRARRNNETVNCYPDFDIKAIFNSETYEGVNSLRSIIRMSPDFYLRNETLTGQSLANYISEAGTRIIDTTKMCKMIALNETEDTLTRYNEIRSLLSDLPAKTKQEIEEALEYKTDLASSLTNVRNKYVELSRATPFPGKDVNNPNDKEDLKKEILGKWVNEFPRDGKGYSEFEKYIDVMIEAQTYTGGDTDKRVMDLVHSARKKSLVTLLSLYSGVNKYMSGKLTQNPSLLRVIGAKPVKANSLDNLSLDDLGLKALLDIQNSVTKVLENSSNLAEINKVLKNSTISKGVGHAGKLDNKSNSSKQEPTYMGLPDINKLQNMVANEIADFYRLTSYIEEAESLQGNGGIPPTDLLGEYGIIGYWNWQQMESNVKMFDMLNSLVSTTKNAATMTLKMFPTFKFFFVEEDSGIVRNSDELFSYDAIQSIEIVRSKASAGATAVIRLSNLTGSLTDSLTFHREKADLLRSVVDKPYDNTFFGTLNIKPGCGVLIKLGYAAHSDSLETLFSGRITEMSVGNNVEIICQSYAVQLNHKVVQHKFSLGAKEKGHGDIAIASLDMIPGLEKLGKKITNMDFGGIKSFNTTNMGNYRGTFTDRFLMGHLFGKALSLANGYPNPRDENIFLPFDPLGAADILYRPTFDWVIYDQTIWSVLQELALYYRNTSAIVKPYNNDNFTSIRETRESIVIGDKSGYYKSTDAFSLSSLNIRNATAVIDDYNKNVRSIIIQVINNNNTQPFTRVDQAVLLAATGFSGGGATRTVGYTLKPEFKSLFMFLQDKLSADILIKFFMERIKTDQIDSVQKWFNDFTKSQFKSMNPDEQIMFDIFQFSRADIVPIDTNPDFNFFYETYATKKRELFERIILNLRKIGKDKTRVSKEYKDFVLDKENFYNVSDIYKNNDPKLIRDPRYTKIQQHHLITDSTDILSNNIVLSENFKNMVNLYYLEEPKLVSQDNINSADWEKINVFPIKAFGDIKDEFVRPLETFQKNVDTNFWDATKGISDRFAQYSRLYNNENKDNLLKFLNNKAGFNQDVPNWDALPAFVTVGINLLKNEVAKMYQGTIEIVGNPYINPYDIVHIEDYTNDLHGAVEVEEVVHSFTPDRGFRTVITPNLITYDRDPIQMQDLQVINDVFKVANNSRRLVLQGLANSGWDLAAQGIIASVMGFIGKAKGAGFAKPFLDSLVGLGAKSGWGKVLGLAVTATTLGPAAYNGVVGTKDRQGKFLMDAFAKIWGRDCVNFTTLIYKGLPFITGFGGVDYTNLKALINHNVEGIQNPISRVAAFKDPFMAYFDPGYGWLNILTENYALPKITGDVNLSPYKSLPIGGK